MDRPAVPFMQPESPRKPLFLPMQRGSEQHSRINARKHFNYEFFFELMQVVENGHKDMMVLPRIKDGQPEESDTEIDRGTRKLNALVSYNEMNIREIVQRIGGLPVRELVANHHGVISQAAGLTNGLWNLEFTSFTSGETRNVQHSTLEIRDAYRAAQSQIIVLDTVQEPDSAVNGLGRMSV